MLQHQTFEVRTIILLPVTRNYNTGKPVNRLNTFKGRYKNRVGSKITGLLGNG